MPVYPTSWRSIFISLFHCLDRTKGSVQVRGTSSYFVTLYFFLQWGVVSTSPKLQLEDHLLSAVRDCLFNIFAATFHTGGRSSIRNLTKHHAVVTGTHSTRDYSNIILKKYDGGFYEFLPLPPANQHSTIALYQCLPNVFARVSLLASKCAHGSSHPCSRKYIMAWW
jgi:hypothetical protein